MKIRVLYGLCHILLAICSLSCITAQETLTIKGWRNDGENYQWPESEFYGSTTNSAISFSGGGTRSYLLTLGSLRALYDLGLLPKTRFITGVSGGSWAVLAYTYFRPSASVEEDKDPIQEFLGDVINPENMTMKQLNTDIPHTSGRAAPTKSLIDAAIALLLDRKVASSHLIWRKAVSKIFLEPYNIKATALPAWNNEILNDLFQRNPSLSGLDWITPCTGNNCSYHADDIIASNRPFPIIGSTMLGPKDGFPFSSSNNMSFDAFEMNPMYVGSPFTTVRKYLDKKGNVIGNYTLGGFIETVGFGGHLVPANTTGIGKNLSGILKVSTNVSAINAEGRGPLTVSDMAGISSWALAGALSTIPILKGFGNIADLSFDTWPPSATLPNDSTSVHIQNSSFLYGDGGCVDNSNFLMLVRRKVSNIVLFYNAQDPLSPETSFNASERPPKSGDLDSVLPAYFGYLIYQMDGFWDYSHLQIFAKEDFPVVIGKLQESQKSGRGAVATTSLTTIENKFFGIPAGITVNVTWVYLSRAYIWENALPEEVAKHVIPDSQSRTGWDPTKSPSLGPFKNFPYTNDFSQLHVKNSLANLIPNFGGWIVKENSEQFIKALS